VQKERTKGLGRRKEGSFGLGNERFGLGRRKEKEKEEKEG